MSLWVVVGGQYGSEGKGKISAFIALQEDIDICIRCGGPNSGHSFQTPEGATILLRQLPTGFINPKTRLLIPAGALIDLPILKAEIDQFGLSEERVGIDGNATVIEESDRHREAELGLRERLSSTLCGVGSAVARRVLRGADVRLAKDAAAHVPWLTPLITDVSEESCRALHAGKKVLVEGTQGCGLSLYHSRDYPKATSRDTTAAGFLSEVGLSPRWVTEIILVLRTFPIRVAGEQAGPFFKPTSWEDIQKNSGYPHPIQEFTSVTRQLRRVGEFDWKLAARAGEINRPTRIALNGLDYLNFADFRACGLDHLSLKATAFVKRVESELCTPVTYVGVGPSVSDVLARAHSSLLSA